MGPREAELLSWVEHHEAALAVLGIVSALTFVGSLLALPVLVARMPADYFIGDAPHPFAEGHPALRLALLVLKNLFGFLLVLAGIAMLVLPGQGLLTILIGLVVMDFPGKRGLELNLARRATIRRAVGWLRRRAGRPPLRFPGEPEAPEDPPDASPGG